MQDHEKSEKYYQSSAPIGHIMCPDQWLFSKAEAALLISIPTFFIQLFKYREKRILLSGKVVNLHVTGYIYILYVMHKRGDRVYLSKNVCQKLKKTEKNNRDKQYSIGLAHSFHALEIRRPLS